MVNQTIQARTRIYAQVLTSLSMATMPVSRTIAFCEAETSIETLFRARVHRMFVGANAIRLILTFDYAYH